MIKKFKDFDPINESENLCYTSFFGKNISHDEAFRKRIEDDVIGIITDENGISEKAFGKYGDVIDMVRNDMTEDMCQEAQEIWKSGKRLRYVGEMMYEKYFKPNESTVEESSIDEFNAIGSAIEFLMVVHFESGDEIHLRILEMKHLDEINSLIGDGHPGNVKGEELTTYIYENSIEDIMCQTYVLEDYTFTKFNIGKIIHIPELGH